MRMSVWWGNEAARSGSSKRPLKEQAFELNLEGRYELIRQRRLESGECLYKDRGRREADSAGRWAQLEPGPNTGAAMKDASR